jgi:uncharacterized protein (DUF4415 family)
MNKKMKTHSKIRSPVFDADGYESAPPDVARALANAAPTADFLPPPDELLKAKIKVVTTIRLDHDVVEWFRSMGKGYQTKINAVLKAYKAVHEKG